jgi:transcriptional regulator of aromatic amino acid metabolism
MTAATAIRPTITTRPNLAPLDPAVAALNAAYALRDTLTDLCQQYPGDPDLAARLAVAHDLVADATWRTA